MANIAIISKTPDSLLPEIIPTTICQWQTGTGRTIYCIRMWAFSQYFLYLCALELLPTSVLVSAMLFLG